MSLSCQLYDEIETRFASSVRFVRTEMAAFQVQQAGGRDDQEGMIGRWNLKQALRCKKWAL